MDPRGIFTLVEKSVFFAIQKWNGKKLEPRNSPPNQKCAMFDEKLPYAEEKDVPKKWQ